jgi:hypothetical protein
VVAVRQEGFGGEAAEALGGAGDENPCHRTEATRAGRQLRGSVSC